MRNWMAALMVGAALLAGHAQVHAGEMNLGELNLMGDFKSPWKTQSEEIAAMKPEEKRWAASTKDFHAVYKRQFQIEGAPSDREPFLVSKLNSFLGGIDKQKLGSIKRINLISHGSRGMMAFTGDIDPRTGRVNPDEKTALDLRISDIEYRPTGDPLKLEESVGMMARKLRNRFQKGAEIVVYTCNGGADPELLQEIANAFQVVASGFKGRVWFCPKWSVPPYAGPTSPVKLIITRSLTSLDSNCSDAKPGFKHLDPHLIRTPPKPDPK